MIQFEDMASKRENWPNVFKFNPFSSLSPVATDDRKQFQCCKVLFNNKTRPLFLEFN